MRAAAVVDMRNLILTILILVSCTACDVPPIYRVQAFTIPAGECTYQYREGQVVVTETIMVEDESECEDAVCDLSHSCSDVEYTDSSGAVVIAKCDCF